MCIFRRRLVMTTALAAFASVAAQAQTVPGSAQPGLLQQQFEEHNPVPNVGGNAVISSEPVKAKHTGSQVHFVLHTLTLEGGTAYKADELKPLWADKLGQDITLDDLNDIAAQITNYYRNHGYILTRATVPPQRVEGGNVTIRIVEGYVSDVKIIDKTDKQDSLVRAYADKITAAKPLDAATLERYLLLMDDLPGVEARAVLVPSPDTQGATEVDVTITRKPVEFSASTDNRGTRYLGPVEAFATVGFNDLLGLDEQTQLRAANTIFKWNEMKYGELRHEEQLGDEGLKLIVAGSEIQTKPRYTLEPLDIDGLSKALSVGLSYPYIRSRQENLFLNTDVTLRDTNTDYLAGNLFEDRTRVWTAGAAFDMADSWQGVNRLQGSVSKGLPWDVGVDENSHSRDTGTADFVKIDAKASRLQTISGPWSAQVSGSGQLSNKPLYAAEEFAIGGGEFGSAYDPAEITGDSGIVGRFELQYNQAPQLQFLQQYQLYGFYEGGAIWNRDATPGLEDKYDSLTDLGVGARFNISQSVSGSLEGALPLTHSVETYSGYPARVFFGLQYRY